LLRRLNHERPEALVDDRGNEWVHSWISVDTHRAEERQTWCARLVLQKTFSRLSNLRDVASELVPPQAAQWIIHTRQIARSGVILRNRKTARRVPEARDQR
jgi:hypothetical protein